MKVKYEKALTSDCFSIANGLTTICVKNIGLKIPEFGAWFQGSHRNGCSLLYEFNSKRIFIIIIGQYLDRVDNCYNCDVSS